MIRIVAIALLAGCELFVPRGTLADEDCTTNAAACVAPSVCDVGTGTCVECAQDSDCTSAARPVCDLATHTCSTCGEDAQCTSESCLPDGSCADEARVLYAAVTGAGLECSRMNRCTLDTAIMQLTAELDIVQLAPGTYDLLATLVPMVDAIVNGADARIRLGAATYIFQYQGISLQLHRLVLDAPGSVGAFCAGDGKLSLVRTQIDGASAAVLANPCEVTIDRSTFSFNQFYAILVGTGPLKVTNSYFTRNGNVGQTFPGLILDNLVAGSVIEHTTIADNLNDGSLPSALQCDGSEVAVFRNNIIRNNLIPPTCTVSSSVIDNGYTGLGSGNTPMDPGFVDPAANNYRLAPGSPIAGLSDASTMTVDFDGEARPLPAGSTPDPGADEIP